MASAKEFAGISLQLTHDELDTILGALCFVYESKESSVSLADGCMKIWRDLVH